MRTPCVSSGDSGSLPPCKGRSKGRPLGAGSAGPRIVVVIRRLGLEDSYFRSDPGVHIQFLCLLTAATLGPVAAESAVTIRRSGVFTLMRLCSGVALLACVTLGLSAASGQAPDSAVKVTVHGVVRGYEHSGAAATNMILNDGMRVHIAAGYDQQIRTLAPIGSLVSVAGQRPADHGGDWVVDAAVVINLKSNASLTIVRGSPPLGPSPAERATPESLAAPGRPAKPDS